MCCWPQGISKNQIAAPSSTGRTPGSLPGWRGFRFRGERKGRSMKPKRELSSIEDDLKKAIADEFGRIENEFLQIAKDFEYDLTNDSDFEKLVRIGDGEFIFREDGNDPARCNQVPEWVAAGFAEKKLAYCLGLLSRIDSRIKCPCAECDAKSPLLHMLCTASYVVGFLRAYPLTEPDDFPMESFFSEMGAAGAKVRHAPMQTLRAWTINEYQKAVWPSANAAAFDLAAKVVNHGRTIGAHLSEANAQRTIAEWIRRASKSV